MDQQELKAYYISILPTLNKLVSDLVQELNDFIKTKELNNIDFVKYRVKETDSILKKSLREIDGKLKYLDPIFDIQDIIGIRIIVYYLSDVDKVFNTLKKKLYNQIEITHHKPSSDDDFKYEGKHYIIPIPITFQKKYKTEGVLFPTVFELQILTLFQHAWSTGEHDLTYKPKYTPSHDNKRYLAFVAAQAWGADKIFNQVNDELNSRSTE